MGRIGLGSHEVPWGASDGEAVRSRDLAAGREQGAAGAHLDAPEMAPRARALKGRLGHFARPEGRDEPFRGRALAEPALQRTEKPIRYALHNNSCGHNTRRGRQPSTHRASLA